MRALYLASAPLMPPDVCCADVPSLDADEKRRWEENRRCAWRIHGGRPAPPPRNPSANGRRPAIVNAPSLIGSAVTHCFVADATPSEGRSGPPHTGRERSRDSRRVPRGSTFAPRPREMASASVAMKRQRRNPPCPRTDEAGARYIEQQQRQQHADDSPVAAPSSRVPEIPHQVLHEIFRRVLRADDGGIPALLAAGAVCRGWRAAANDPALWAHVARTRFGLHDFPLEDRANREAVRRMACERSFAFSYARARWWRAVSGVVSYRVTLHPPRSHEEIVAARGGGFQSACVLDDGLPTPMTYYGEVADDYGYVDGSDSEAEPEPDEGGVWDGEHRRPRRSIVGDDQNQNQNHNHNHNRDDDGSDDDYVWVWTPPPDGSLQPTERVCEAPRTDGGAPARRRLLRNADSAGRRGTFACVVPANGEDARVTDHALILRLPPTLSARRLENYCVVRGGGDGGGASEATRYLRVSVHVRTVGDEKSAPGRDGEARGGRDGGHPRALCHAWLRVDGGDVVVASADDDGGGGEGGNASSAKKKKRVALVIDGFTHLAHRARPGRCFEAFGVPRPPSSNRRWGVGVVERGDEWEDDVIHADHRNKATHLRARYRARRGFRGENNGAHTPGAHFGVNYGARGCPYALVGRVGASASTSAGGAEGLIQSLTAETPARMDPVWIARRLTPDLLDDVADGFIASLHFTHAREIVGGRIGGSVAGFSGSSSAGFNPPVSITDSPAVVVDVLPRPRRVDPDVLVFKVTGGAALNAMSSLERLDERDVLPRPGSSDDRWGSVRCHVVFTHRTGRAFVSAPALAAASYIGGARRWTQNVGQNIGQSTPSGNRPATGSRAGHYGVTFAGTPAGGCTYQVLPRRSHTWGAGGFGEYDPGDVLARPVRVVVFDCVVAVGHSVLITVPARALVDAHEAAERSVRHELREFLAEEEGKRLVREATRAG